MDSYNSFSSSGVLRRRRRKKLSNNSRFVSGDHVLDVDEGVVTSMLLKNLQSGQHQVAHGGLLLLRIIDVVADIECVVPENVHDRQQLPVVRH